jgi:hypothetical protein
MLLPVSLLTLSASIVMQGGWREPLDATLGIQNVASSHGMADEVYLSPGETMRIAVVRDGGVDLDGFIHDENGNPVTCDSDRGARLASVLLHPWMERFFIHVEDLGPVYSRFELLA